MQRIICWENRATRRFHNFQISPNTIAERSGSTVTNSASLSDCVRFHFHGKLSHRCRQMTRYPENTQNQWILQIPPTPAESPKCCLISSVNSSFPCVCPSSDKLRHCRSSLTIQRLYESAKSIEPMVMIHSQLAMLLLLFVVFWLSWEYLLILKSEANMFPMWTRMHLRSCLQLHMAVE